MTRGPDTADAHPYVSDWRVLRELTRSLPRGMSRPARELYHLLAGHTGANGVCYVSIGTLATEADLHPGTIRKARGELERLGLIVTFAGGGRQANLYRLVDFRCPHPAPVGAGSGTRPRASGRGHPAPTGALPRASGRDVEVEEQIEERAPDLWMDTGETAAAWALRLLAAPRGVP